MSNLIINMERINSLKPTDIAKDEAVKAKWINIYNTINGEDGESAYEAEMYFFNSLLTQNKALLSCSKFSIFNAFIQIAINGISVRPGVAAMAYIQPRNVKAGRDSNGNDVWESNATFTISGYGELYMRQRAGQIRYADNPVIVYDCDAFAYGESRGTKYVDYQAAFPRPASAKPVAAYMKIVRNDGGTDYSVMTQQDWMRLSSFSARQNKGRVNDLYTSNDGSIDTGFLAAKLIKHAFRAYPRLKVGQHTFFETNDEQPIAQHSEEDYSPAPDLNDGITFGQDTAQPASAPSPAVAAPAAATSEKDDIF